MKLNSSSFLENRTFDQRLVKNADIDKWNLYGDIYRTRTDYRQFLDSCVSYLNKFHHFIFVIQLILFLIYKSVFKNI